VWELDSAVGAIASALREREMWRNSLLVFSTDNGSPLNNGGNNAPLRGSKMTDWEGDWLRVPPARTLRRR
jgi:arylsulfatase A-like enzyme